MVNVELNVLLHKTVKNLHTLNTSTLLSKQEYETLLKDTIVDLLKLLDYYEKPYKNLELKVDTSNGDIGSFSLLCYINNTETKERSDLNLLSYLQTYNDNDYSTKNILKQIIQFLTKMHDKKPIRIKDSFTFILVKFSKLLNIFIDLQNVSEQRFIDYLNKCYQHEIDYYSDIQKRLETNSVMEEKDTQKIIDLLDNMILGDLDQVPQEDDSIFSYATDMTNVPKSSALNIKSDDKNFDELYYVFLHILRTKPTGTDYTKYIRLMLNIYKKHNKICSIEINDFKFKELKVNSFCNFFIGDDEKDAAILPMRYQDINDKLLSENVIFPEMKSISNSSFNRSDISENLIDEPGVKVENSDYLKNEEIMINHYSMEDQHKIVNNLKHIIPLLNEFDLNFDLEFPSIFKLYLKYTYNSIDFECDLFDYDYINKIMVILNYLVDFENNELTSEEVLIKEKVEEFHKLHLYLSAKNQIVNSSTLLMRLALIEYKNNTNLKVTYLREWNFKTLEVSQLEYNLVNHWIEQNNLLIQTRILKIWFSKFLKVNKLDSEISQYTEKVLMNKYLNIVWRKRIKRNKENIQITKELIIRRYYNCWNSKIKRNFENVQIAKNYDMNLTASQILDIWVKKYRNFLTSQEDSQSLYESLLEKRNLKLKFLIWKSWYNSMNNKSVMCTGAEIQSSPEPSTEISLSHKIRQLSEYEIYFVKQKYFKIWKSTFSLKNIYNQVRLSNEFLLKRFVFEDEWLKKTKLQFLSTEILRKKYSTEKRKIINSWREILKLKSISNDFNRRRLLVSSFSLWKLKMKSNFIQTNFSDKYTNIKNVILKHCFKNWILQFRLRQVILHNSRDSCMKYYKTWKGNCDMIEQHKHNADILLNSFVRQNTFSKWYGKLKLKNSLNVETEIFVKRKFFKLMVKKYTFYTQDMIIAANDYSKLGNLNARMLLLVTFSKWQNVYDRRYQKLSELKISHFHQTIINRNLLNNSLVEWVNAYNKRQANFHELILKEKVILRKSPLKRIFFKKWNSSTKSKLQLLNRAELFEQTLLYKKFLIIWYDQFINKRIHLEEISNNYIDQSDFRKVNEILKSWSMRYLKSFRRNQENCNDFIERWNNAKVRAIFDLWVYKSREINNDTTSKDDYVDESSLSIASNASPLTKKAYSQTVQHENSYLYTPLKSQVRISRTIGTPASPRLSPTKLQETTLRLKNERIDALRKHFGKAKKGTSPARKSLSFTPTRNAIKAGPFNRATNSKNRIPLPSYSQVQDDFNKLNLENTKFIRLSPPKARSSNIISPPDPPNFDLGESNSMLADLSASTEIIKDNSADEKSVIETAKKLRRITPIVFPTEEMEIEPIFSPVNELKERLKNNYFSLSSNEEEEVF